MRNEKEKKCFSFLFAISGRITQTTVTTALMAGGQALRFPSGQYGSSCACPGSHRSARRVGVACVIQSGRSPTWWVECRSVGVFELFGANVCVFSVFASVFFCVFGGDRNDTFAWEHTGNWVSAARWFGVWSALLGSGRKRIALAAVAGPFRLRFIIYALDSCTRPVAITVLPAAAVAMSLPCTVSRARARVVLYN